MCNLYSVTKGQQAIREFTRATTDRTGNLPPQPGIFPDQMAPVVRNAEGGPELLMMRWGFPPPPRVGEHAVTNVRNVGSSYWRPWLKAEHRCLVPATSFSEYADTRPRKTPVWFALGEERPLFALAGIWRPWRGVRGTKAENPEREEADHMLFAFLTTEPNAIVGPVHPKAMPAILTTPDECEAWLTGSVEDALQLQRPLPDDALQVVARGERHDGKAA